MSCRRALVFFPHNPWPARTGAHARALAQLGALRDLGYATVLCSSTATSDSRWDPDVSTALERELRTTVALHVPDAADAHWAARQHTGTLADLGGNRVSPGLRQLFRAVLDAWSPELVVVNYAYWHGLLHEVPAGAATTAIENHDLVSWNAALRDALDPALGPRPHSARTASAEALDPGFPPSRAIEGSAELAAELRAYATADLCITISRVEAELIRRCAPQVRVAEVPMTFRVPEGVRNTYDGAPVFVAAPNPFNVQGYLHLAARVLPQVRAVTPGARVAVVGGLGAVMAPHEGMAHVGFVPELAPVYTQSPFAVCPLLAGTGQQVKIAEAMAHGVAVVAYEGCGRASPMEHGVNGLLARSPEEFAEHVVHLLRDRALCRRLGERAREAARERCAPSVAAGAWREALQGARSPRAVAGSTRRPAAGAPRVGAGTPPVTIVLPCYDKVDLTRRCLASLMANTPRELFELVVVDNGSTDATPQLLATLDGARVVRLDPNRGYIGACNRGALEARAPWLLMLSNDTEVRRGWLEALLALAEAEPSAGAVGSKLLYPDGRLQEAGALVFSDGSGWTFGNGDDPARPLYNERIPVDYCSGAALMVKRSLFAALGGLDARYAPAYYDDSDLCFGVRALGSEVLYCPGSEVVHVEGGTNGAGPSSRARQLIETNRPKFLAKWRDALRGHEPPAAGTGRRPLTADRRALGRRLGA